MLSQLPRNPVTVTGTNTRVEMIIDCHVGPCSPTGSPGGKRVDILCPESDQLEDVREVQIVRD